MTHISISRNARRLLTVTSRVHRRMAYWDCEHGHLIIESPVVQPFARTESYSHGSLAMSTHSPPAPATLTASSSAHPSAMASPRRVPAAGSPATGETKRGAWPAVDAKAPSAAVGDRKALAPLPLPGAGDETPADECEEDFFVAFDPLSDREWCTGNNQAVTTWRFDVRFGSKHLSPMYLTSPCHC